MKNRGTLVMLAAIVFVMAVGWTACHLNRDNRSTADYVAEVNNTNVESHRYPAPTGTERKLAEYYTSGAIQYIIDWTLQTTGDTPPVGDHEFLVTLYNSLNRSVSVSAEDAKAFTIGCVAYKDDRAATAGGTEALNFQPYERKRINVTVKSTCAYLGTADGSAYWPIY